MGKTKSRKRHIVLDVLGCLLSVNIHAANVYDTKSGIVVAKQAFEKYPSIKKFCADSGYRGTFVNDIKNQISLRQNRVYIDKKSRGSNTCQKSKREK